MIRREKNRRSLWIDFQKFVVGLAGFEPAISWAPGGTIRSQATRPVRMYRGYCPLDLASRQPLNASRMRCCFSSYLSKYNSSTRLFLTKGGLDLSMQAGLLRSRK